MWEEALKIFWQNLTEVLPPVFWAFLAVLIGWFIAQWLGKIATAFLSKIRLNQILKNIGVEAALAKIDTRLNAPKFFGEMVRWFFVILFFLLAAESLGLTSLSQFLWKVINYYPNVFIAAFIFLVAVFLANFSQKILTGALEKERITYSRLLGRATSWAVWLFAVLAILYQLKIVPSLILVIFVGIIITISLAIGIAFGFGGKDLAAKILKELEEKFK